MYFFLKSSSWAISSMGMSLQRNTGSGDRPSTVAFKKSSSPARISSSP